MKEILNSSRTIYRTDGYKEINHLYATLYFERALAVARQQPAKSWELRAAFDTRDLKEANELLDTLAS